MQANSDFFLNFFLNWGKNRWASGRVKKMDVMDVMDWMDDMDERIRLRSYGVTRGGKERGRRKGKGHQRTDTCKL